MSESTLLIPWFDRTRLRVPRLAFRWMLLLFFPIGFLATSNSYWHPEYLSMHVLCTASLALLLLRMNRPLYATLPVWIILSVFLIGYFLKFYSMTRQVSVGDIWLFIPFVEYVAKDQESMIRVFQIITSGFTAFCVAGWISLSLPQTKSSSSLWEFPTHSRYARERVWLFCIRMLLAMGALALITGIAQIITGVGVMGSESVSLPYRMAGVIVHSRMFLIPAMLVLVIHLSEAYGFKRILLTAIVLLFLHALCDSFLRASRGALVGLTMPVFILWLLQKRFTRPRLNILVALILVVALIHPLINGLRVLRAGGAGLSVDTIQEARALGAATRSAEGFINAGIMQVVNRVAGTEILLYAVDWSAPDVPNRETIRYFLQDPERDLARVMTQDVARFGRDNWVHLYSPTLLAAPYLIGGLPLVMMVASSWVLMWVLFRRWYLRLKLRTTAMIDAMVLSFLLSITSEFAVPDAIIMFFSLLIPTVIFAEIAMARSGIPYPRL